MTEKKMIPITDPQHLIELGMTLGLLTALEALDDIEMADKLTGVGVARHALKAAEAQHRVTVMQRNIRLAVKQGVDLDTHHVMWQGKPEIWAEPNDSAPGKKGDES